MSATKIPTERILRQLFWTLLVRGRTAPHEGKSGKKGLGIKSTCAIYALFGLMPVLSASLLSATVFASLLHGFTMMFAALTLASSAGSMLFAREEAEILLHRPVPAAHLLRAKAWVLLRYAMILAVSLNLAGLIGGMFVTDLGWQWLPVHLATTTLLMVFATAVIVLTYNLCLRWFGRERLDNLLAAVQTLMTLVMIAGSQLVPRLMMQDGLDDPTILQGWALLLPPVWFGSLDAVLCGAMPWATAWLPASLAVAGTALCAWLAFGLLANSYGAGLASIGEGADRRREAGRGRRLSRIVEWRPLRRWLRDPLQRHAFVMTSAYLSRDRETKIKTFPAMVPLLIMPVIMAVPLSGGSSQLHPVMIAIAFGYLAMVPLSPLVLLRRSEHYRTAEIYQYSPLPHWSPLFHGCRKAVMLWLVFPSWLIITALLCLFSSSLVPVATGIPILLALPIYSLVPALHGAWLPLALPNEALKDASLGCLTTAFAIGSGMALSVVAGLIYMAGTGWFLLYLLLSAGASIYIYRAMAESIANRDWQPSKRASSR
ncbi:MAG: ABC-2 type transport system permease protein [Neolewinella sp.]